MRPNASIALCACIGCNIRLVSDAGSKVMVHITAASASALLRDSEVQFCSKRPPIYYWQPTIAIEKQLDNKTRSADNIKNYLPSPASTE